MMHRKEDNIIGENDLKAIRAIAKAVIDGKIKIVSVANEAKAPYSYTPEQFARMIWTFANNALFHF